jgi:hypothetical protein
LAQFGHDHADSDAAFDHMDHATHVSAMAFSLFVEVLNLKIRSQKPAPHALPSRRLQKAITRIEGRR